MTDEELKAKLKELRQERAKINKQLKEMDAQMNRYSKALVRSYAPAGK